VSDATEAGGGQVLLVEDDDGIATPLTVALRRDGHQVRRVATGGDALAAVAAGSPDAVLLDLGLPDLDGVEVCRRLRAAHPTLPILVLTARATEVDIVVGLDAGADDYVTKPFRLAELLARLRAMLRRAGAEPPGNVTHPARQDATVQAQDVRVDMAARRAWRGERQLELTPKEFDLLALLVAEAGTVLSRDRLMEEVWDVNWYGSTKTLDMHVSWLRRKLDDDAASPRYVSTVRGVGFRFEPEAPR